MDKYKKSAMSGKSPIPFLKSVFKKNPTLAADIENALIKMDDNIFLDDDDERGGRSSSKEDMIEPKKDTRTRDPLHFFENSRTYIYIDGGHRARVLFFES